MEEIVFRVQGSAAEPYVVQFKKDGSNLIAKCDCPAGVIGQSCKHRLRILDGSNEGIISGNADEIERIVAWLKGSDVETTIRQLRDAEERQEVAKKEVAMLKKKLGKVLQG